ncbi:MAG: ThuA domain-containing protein, partial [Rubripirellula sp.]
CLLLMSGCLWALSPTTFAESTEQLTGKHPVPASGLWLTFAGENGPGTGKHIVLIAADQEYRSEQSLPMLAKVLSSLHGFDCTVLFSVNEKGQVDPTLPAPPKDKSKHHRIPGLEYLADADCVILLSRFMKLTDDQMQHFHDYFDSGKPLIALRTTNHGFQGGKRYRKGGMTVPLRELLGGTFMGHHGGWHRESTRGIVVEGNEAHPILSGVKDIWGTSDVYRCHNDRFPFPVDCTALVMGQPLINLQPDAPPNDDKEPLPVAWTKVWTGDQGKPSKIFHFTMGSAEDFQNDGVRRMTVNAVYWGLGMEASIDTERSVEPIEPYHPMKAGFNYEKLGVQPREAKFFQ